MTRRLIATAILAATVGAPVLAAAPVARASGNEPPLVCVGGDNQRRPGYGMGVCVDDPTRG